jgi:hypothetical protein
MVAVGGDGNWCIKRKWLKGSYNSFLLSQRCLSRVGRVVMAVVSGRSEG